MSLNGQSVSIGGLTGDSSAIVQNNHGSTASTLTVGLASGTNIFSGVMKNGAAATLSLAKDGEVR